MQKNYDHNSTEDELYAEWKKSGKMRADETSRKKPFTIPLPPPNVTGQLHLGHSAMLAIEDILIRYKKMTGHESLWIPGTDHAAIATESVVLKHLNLQSREEFCEKNNFAKNSEEGRKSFLEECKKFAQEKHDRICHQMEKMGGWLDWSREAYTFDETRNDFVNQIFVQLFKDGLIEKGHRMINWSTGAQSVISDDELEWEEIHEPFYYIRCGKFIIGTVRSETKCANSPVIVNPEGKYVIIKNAKNEKLVLSKFAWENNPVFAKLKETYKLETEIIGHKLVGEKFEYETYAGKRKFWVLADKIIDMEKGTGAMTISASHSEDDYELATRLNLKELFHKKIDFQGKMTNLAGELEGIEVKIARKRSAKLMKEKDLLIAVDENYSHRIPICYRSGCVIEPMVSPQWFVAVDKEFDFHENGNLNKKKRGSKFCSNGKYFKPTQIYDTSIFDSLVKVKKKKVKVQLKDFHKTIEINGKTIIFDGEKLDLHFKNKPSQEKFFRRIWFFTVVRSLSEINFNKKNVGYFCVNNLVFRIVLEKIKEKYYVKTFYLCLSMTVFYNQKIFGGNSSSSKKTTLKKITQEAVRENFVKIIPKRFDKTYFQWIDNLRDWCISRQIWWGHRIPVWYDEKGKIVEVGDSVEIREKAKKENLKQETDTLDTWFSSALWPFSILDKPEDFDKFYPNSVLETGHDILFFWVARMIMFGKYATGKYPFRTVYLHGLVCDEKGQKMSKSKGNGIDPLEVIKEVGADAVRLSLVIGTTPGNNIPIGENKIKGYRNFVNKLWNAGRFIQMNNENLKIKNENLENLAKNLSDKWILSRFSKVSKEIREHLEKYEISSAGDKIYHFVWDEFCAWFLESQKISSNPIFLSVIFREILKLVHPICPFITEKLWQELFSEKEFLIETEFPNLDFYDKKFVKKFENIQEISRRIRNLRAENKINPKDKILAKTSQKFSDEEIKLLKNFANLEITDKNLNEKCVSEIVEFGFVELPKDEKKIAKEKSDLEDKIKSLETRLSNKNYVKNAPKKLVESSQKELNDAKQFLKNM